MDHTVFVHTANHTKLLEALAALEDTVQGTPGLGLVYGRAGRGKTESARTYVVQANGRAKYIRVMEDWTPAAMCRAIASSLAPVEPRTVEQGKHLICQALHARRQTLIIDEADRLRAIGLVEHLRDIHDTTGAPIVLVGEEGLYGMINARRRIWSRVTQHVEFGALTLEDVVLYASKAAKLDVSEVATTLAERCQGDFRLCYRDLAALERLAKANATPADGVTMEHIAPITPAMVKTLPELHPQGKRGRA